MFLPNENQYLIIIVEGQVYIFVPIRQLVLLFNHLRQLVEEQSEEQIF